MPTRKKNLYIYLRYIKQRLKEPTKIGKWRKKEGKRCFICLFTDNKWYNMCLNKDKFCTTVIWSVYEKSVSRKSSLLTYKTTTKWVFNHILTHANRVLSNIWLFYLLSLWFPILFNFFATSKTWKLFLLNFLCHNNIRLLSIITNMLWPRSSKLRQICISLYTFKKFFMRYWVLQYLWNMDNNNKRGTKREEISYYLLDKYLYIWIRFIAWCMLW